MIGIIILLLLPHLSFSQAQLKVGDLLLQPLHCWVCSLIEAEEDSIYSHMGIVLETSPQILVGEAWGIVQAIPFNEFRSKTQMGQRLRILRFQSDIDGNLLREKFSETFENRTYDPHFGWDNYDESGEELFYCSEMIAKLLTQVTQVPMPLKAMSFQINREHWLRYFKGIIPDQKPGNSPADFLRSNLFQDMGEL